MTAARAGSVDQERHSPSVNWKKKLEVAETSREMGKECEEVVKPD